MSQIHAKETPVLKLMGARPTRKKQLKYKMQQEYKHQDKGSFISKRKTGLTFWKSIHEIFQFNRNIIFLKNNLINEEKSSDKHQLVI